MAFGTIAATFAVGLTLSLNEVGRIQDPEDRAAVTVFTGGPGVAHGEHVPTPGTPEPRQADPAQVSAAIEAQSGTASYYGEAQQDATVAGVTGNVRATLFQGDLSTGAYAMTSGHWLDGTGQVVVPGQFLDTTGTEIGDTVRVTVGKETAALRIVGVAFGSAHDQLEIQVTPPTSPRPGPRCSWST